MKWYQKGEFFLLIGCALLGALLFPLLMGDAELGGVGVIIGAYIAGIIKFRNPLWIFANIWKRIKQTP